jgi:hypothetical protein
MRRSCEKDIVPTRGEGSCSVRGRSDLAVPAAIASCVTGYFKSIWKTA